jgi:cytochrome c-type biogenesis protein CcmE
MDDVNKYEDKRLRVPGEVEEHIDPRAFILESGGIFDDEVTVIQTEGVEGLDPSLLREDSDIVVTGKVRTLTVYDVEREY